MHKLLAPTDDKATLPVDVFGYSPYPVKTPALRSGRMNLVPAATFLPAPAVGYAHYMPSPGTTPGPQFIASGDSGGPSFAAVGGGASFLQIGITSFSYAAPGKEAPPSYVVQPVATVATLLLRWFERAADFVHHSTLSAPRGTGVFPYFLDWNGDGLLDFVAIDAQKTRVWLASKSGFLPPTDLPYGYIASFGASIEPDRAVPVRMTDPSGVTRATLVVPSSSGQLDLYREEDGDLFGAPSGQLPPTVGDARTPDNTIVVRVTQTLRDELLFVDPFRMTLIRSLANGAFDVDNPVVTKFSTGDPYGNDFAIADVNGDGRSDFVHRGVDSVDVLLGLPSGAFGGGTLTPLGQTLSNTAGIRFADLNRDNRADLIWVDRQVGAADGRRIHVRLASTEKPGSFEPELVIPIELGDSWGGEGMSQYVGGYAIGDVTGDGVLDLANVGTFGESSGSGVVRTPAIFVKPGRGDGTFEPLRIWRLPTGKLGVKQNLGSGFFVAPVTNTQRADVVFADGLADGHVDIVQSR